MLVPDGAYTFEHGRPHFHRIPAPSHDDLQRLLNTLIQRITRTLVRAGALIEDPLPGEAAQPYLDLELDGGGIRAVDTDGNDLGGHQAFWFAWSQFHPGTKLWPASSGG